jgi:hypothetical protein
MHYAEPNDAVGADSAYNRLRIKLQFQPPIDPPKMANSLRLALKFLKASSPDSTKTA